MLFNSYEFILAFLPVVLIVFYLLGSRGWTEAAIVWLVAASLFFYGWWNPLYLGLLCASLAANFWLGRKLVPDAPQPGGRKAWLVAGLLLNLGLLAYYKYANFFVDSLGKVTGFDGSIGAIVLPLAISFYTFQQIAYLVDAYRGDTREYSFSHYCLFVTFFPQLIAGPIVHHREVLPQFARPGAFRLDHLKLAMGLTLFAIGLFKKVVLGDGMAVYASPAFAAAASGTTLSFFEAWLGTLAYTLQLYFDFSGYSDMACGLALMFGIRLPANFHSPYKAVNIIDFWRRWHMTLSRFLRDYLYIPLGGNRHGPWRRHVNLMITMLLGGLWHGAGWTFVLWGALHGAYLVINHLWHALLRRCGFAPGAGGRAARCAAGLLTFVAVVVAWVPFRAANIDTARSVLSSMAGLNGIGLPSGLAAPVRSLAPWATQKFGLNFDGGFPNNLVFWADGLPWMGVLLVIVFAAPNSNQLLRRHSAVLLPDHLSPERGAPRFPVWAPGPASVLVTAIALVWSLTWMTRVSEFLYFQF
ncbi:MBOAT, membrane-bound O-acyltransferase family protein [Methyloversatilis sp. RAC08]|uniref:MBOAT family O-acyltransferase n=1 Tax=Methyloversatilis sp. RAC08 TaxID=1842540 RepID=UPI00083D2DEB|nr:MBOAT family protein [Methyloversatilis sp. RAC08]AOF82161.1 MBOAT, membrane-bound O-acyltransferase family protein [Methyloversatilis sp. RAC08]